MAYNLQDDAEDYPDLDVLARSRDDWLNCKDVDDVFRLHPNPTVSLEPVEAHEEGLYFFISADISSIDDWGYLSNKKTLENPSMRYSKASIDLNPMAEGLKTSYERRIYKPKDEFAGSKLVHYRVRTRIDDGGELSEDTGEDTEASEEDPEEDVEDSETDDDSADGDNSDSTGDDHDPEALADVGDYSTTNGHRTHKALVDVGVNKVMTTEILRSMQYKRSEIMLEVASFVFDEVHYYMRDSERGLLWEESGVVAPKNSRFVFLSATVPNAKEFADWVAKVHKQPCNIVYTDSRPTPHQHYVFPAGGNGLYLVVDDKAKFHEDSFQKSIKALAPANDGDKKRENGKSQKGLMVGKLGEESDIVKLVKMIIQRQYDPVSLFSFSKKEYEALVMQMSKMDSNNDDEKDSVETISTSAIDMLSDDGKKLPQVSNILPSLEHGIGSCKKTVRRLEALENLFEKHKIAKSPLITQKLKVLHMKEELTTKIKSLKKTIRSSTALAFKDELKARKHVLRRLGYITSDNVVELKGKVACEISSAEELTLTELMFSGVFKEAKVEELVSLLSCFVWRERLPDAAKLREELDFLFIQLQDTARRFAELQLDCKVEIDVESFVRFFRPDIMEAVYAWGKRVEVL